MCVVFVAACCFAPEFARADEDWAKPVRLPAVFSPNEPRNLASLTSATAPLGSVPVDLAPGGTSAVQTSYSQAYPVGDNAGRARTFGSRVLDNATFFLGLDGSKQPQDFGINAQFGGRGAVNFGIPLVESRGIGMQIGTAIDATGDAVQVVQRIQGSSGRTQSFSTVGLYQRMDCGVNWGFVYDFLSENYYDQFSLGQWRVDLSYQMSPRNRIGVWSAISDHSANGAFGAIPITLVPITQTNAYINHTWCNNVQTMFWGGIANSHAQANAVLGDLPRLDNQFVFGAQLFIPLTDRLALFGQGNFIMPAGSGTVDSYLGFVFSPRGGFSRSGGSTFAPLQTVAAPTNFAVDLKRR
jgi:hypothetical protein